MPLSEARWGGFLDLEGQAPRDLKEPLLAQHAQGMKHPALWLVSSSGGEAHLVLVDVADGRFVLVLDAVLAGGRTGGPRQSIRAISQVPGGGPVHDLHLMGEALPGASDRVKRPGPPLTFRHRWSAAGLFERQ